MMNFEWSSGLNYIFDKEATEDFVSQEVAKIENFARRNGIFTPPAFPFPNVKFYEGIHEGVSTGKRTSTTFPQNGVGRNGNPYGGARGWQNGEDDAFRKPEREYRESEREPETWDLKDIEAPGFPEEGGGYDNPEDARRAREHCRKYRKIPVKFVIRGQYSFGKNKIYVYPEAFESYRYRDLKKFFVDLSCLLAHEYFHAVHHHSCNSRTLWRRDLATLYEPAADFFAYLWCKEANMNIEADALLSSWRKYYWTAWPYARALDFLFTWNQERFCIEKKLTLDEAKLHFWTMLSASCSFLEDDDMAQHHECYSRSADPCQLHNSYSVRQLKIKFPFSETPYTYFCNDLSIRVGDSIRIDGKGNTAYVLEEEIVPGREVGIFNNYTELYK